MATTVAILEAKLRADTRDFDRGMSSADRSMSTARKSVLIGAGAIIGGVGMMAKSAISAAADYEKSMNVLQAVSGATGEQMKDLGKEARKLGADTKLPGTSAKDAADSMTELAKAGFNVDQVMKSTRSTLLLSAAAEISNARAAEITANAVNSFGVKAARTNVVVDQLANVANASSVSMEQAADSMQMASAVFAGFQKPTLGAEGAMRELNIAVGILANAGIKGSDAGTSLKQAILQLTGPSGKSADAMKALYIASQSATAGQEQLNAALTGSQKERGAAIEQMLKGNKHLLDEGNIAFTGAGKMRSLHEIIQLVSKGTARMTDEMKANYITQIFGADASRAVIALMNAQVEGWDKMGAAIDKTGSAQAVADAKMKGFRGTMEALKSSIETLQVEFGLMLLPVVTKFAEVLVRGTTVIGQHRIATVVVTTAITAFAVALGVAAVAGMLLRSTLVTAVIPAIIRTTVVQWLLNVALTANPISLVVLALAALAAAFIIAWQRSETFRNIVRALWDVLKITPLGLVIAHLDDVARKMSAAGEKAVAFGKMAVGPIDAVADSFRSVWRWIDKMIGGIKWLIDNIDRIPGLGRLTGGGDPFDPRKMLPPQGPVGAGPLDISPKLYDELAGARAMGLTLTSGYRPGAITRSGHPSDHGIYPSHAIDVAGPAPRMAAFFRWLIGQRDVKQAFYDPLGSIFNGVLSNYREGGHSDHVHVATYDRGGFLRPGWNLAYNGLGRPEPVGAGTVNFNFPNYVGSKQELVSWLQNAAQEFKRRNGRGLV